MNRVGTSTRSNQRGSGSTKALRTSARLRRAVGLAAALLLVAACGADDATGEMATSGSGPEGPTASAADVAVGTTDLGEVLVDGAGMTLYMFDPDADHATSACVDSCAQVWPPLLVESASELSGDGLDTSLLGTIERPDGGLQVTYDGRPLYGWAGDSEPGDVTGQGVDDAWWVIKPSGEVVRGTSAGADSSTDNEGGRPGYGSFGSMSVRDDGY